MTELIVDASVFVSLFDREGENTKRAERLVEMVDNDEVYIVCPELLLLELTNVLVKMKKLGSKEVQKFINTLESIGVEFMQMLPQEMEEIARLMKKYGLTAYDACYLSLAESSDYPLITEDKELLKIAGCKSLKEFLGVDF